MKNPSTNNQAAKLRLTRNAEELLRSYDTVSRAADHVAKNLLLANAGGLAAGLAIFGALVGAGKPISGVLGSLWCFLIGLIFAGADGFRNFGAAKRHQIYNRLQIAKASKELGESSDFDEAALELEYSGLLKFTKGTRYIKAASAVLFCVGATWGLIALGRG